MRRLLPLGHPHKTNEPSTAVARPLYVDRESPLMILPTLPHFGHAVVTSSIRKIPRLFCDALGKLVRHMAPVVVLSPCNPCPLPFTLMRFISDTPPRNHQTLPRLSA
ncbi:hypothetical protein F652_1464 [Enterobacteriaceae bacterium bta3-1]|nr:hypothetical protein F652_1464 [Enterobacteriaceae bacterium bta3-1]